MTDPMWTEKGQYQWTWQSGKKIPWSLKPTQRTIGHKRELREGEVEFLTEEHTNSPIGCAVSDGHPLNYTHK